MYVRTMELQPLPTYMVEWMCADILSGGKLRVQENDKVLVKGLRKQFLRHYARNAKALAVQRDYCISAHAYMLSLGDMEKGDWLCINVENPAELKDFPTEIEMRTHWKKCHGIEMHEEVKPYEVQRLRLPELGTRPKQISKLESRRNFKLLLFKQPKTFSNTK